MKESAYAAVDTLIARYPALEPCGSDIRAAIEALVNSYRAGGKLIVCGNGGSASDAEHIVGELMKGFLLPRHLDEHILRPAESQYLLGKGEVGRLIVRERRADRKL